jgi:hypothetical protein
MEKTKKKRLLKRNGSFKSPEALYHIVEPRIEPVSRMTAVISSEDMYLFQTGM